MMKKTLSLALIAVLTLGLIGTASAVPFRLETPGLTIEIPAYITTVDISEGDICALRMQRPDSTTEIVYAISHDESLAGKWAADLDRDQQTVIAEGFIGEGGVSFLFADKHEGVTYVYACNPSESYCLVYTIMDGWISSCSIISEDSKVESGIVAVADQLLIGISYDDLSPVPPDGAAKTDGAGK